MTHPVDSRLVRYTTRFRVVSMLVCLVAGSASLAADNLSEEQSERSSTLNEMRSLMMRTRVELAGGNEANSVEPVVAQLVDQPLIRFVDEEHKTGDSTFWIWTHDGRPVAAQKLEVNRKTGGNWTYCFASLSEQRIQVTWPNVGENYLTEQGIAFEPISEAPAPRSLKTLRAQQMRALARQFSAYESQGAQHKKLRDLRLMARPIYEFEAADAGVVQGAIFAFASGTNPSVLLMIELREADDGSQTWVSAPIRMTSSGVVLQRTEEVVFISDSEWPRRRFPTWMFTFVGRTGR